MGLATGFWTLSGLLVALGFAEGFNSPALLRTVTDWLSPKWRARAVSLSLLGVPVASLIGAPFLTSLIEKVGWRGMFMIVGTLGIVWAIFWFWFFRNKKSPPYPTPRGIATPWKELFTHRGFRANAFSFFTFGYIVFFVIIWLPGYFQQTYGIAIRHTGFLVMIPWLVAAILQTFGGWLIDEIYKRTESVRKSRVYPLCIGLLVASISFGLLAFSSTLHTSVALMSLGLGFTFLINPAIYALNADIFPGNVATAQGVSTSCFALAGIISPSLTGWITQTTGSYESAIIFIAILPLLASINAFLFCYRKRA
ncbi:MAG TPA: MFS transporter, partial [Chlamydiales bacterium]|nr:MFS transporter [Chlamydiales bacterium]